MRSNFICFGRGGENSSTMMMTMLCDIKDIHMLALNSLIFFARLGRVERPYLYFEWFIIVGLSSWTYRSLLRQSMFMVAFWLLVALGSAVCSSSNWITLTLLVDVIQFLISNLWGKPPIGSQSNSTVSERKACFLGSSCYNFSFISQWVWIKPWTCDPEHLNISRPAN